VFLTEGVSVGDNTVVGANAVVTDSSRPTASPPGRRRVQKFKSYLSDEQRNELADEYADVLAADLAERHRKADSSQ